MQHNFNKRVFLKMLFMKNILLFAVLSLVSGASFAQGGKVINDKNAAKRSVSGFHAIRISSGIDLYLSQAGEEAVAVSASSTEYRDKIRTEVEGGVLKIFIESEGFHWGNMGGRKLKAYVSCKVLDELKASGGSDVYIEDAVRTDKLNLDFSGGSDLRGKVEAHELSVVQSGGSDAYLSGTASRLSVHASGGSDFHGNELTTDNCQIEASGGSDVHVIVNKELSASASGGSDVYYSGNGVVRESHSSGSSSIHKKG
jgi:Putative auto-transporter adhesin, head GIN domain